jgi:AcrR family transcriptional regulator
VPEPARNTPRRRRADARRSVAAILGSARPLLAADAEASIEEIAVAAGVSRQTVYAHFPSRDALVSAVIDVERAEGLAALEAAHLDELPALDALRRFLDISWEIAARLPLVLSPDVVKTPGHDLVGSQLQRIVQRGQDSGDLDDALPASWLTAAIFGLGHCAGEEISAGRLTRRAAGDVLLQSVLRLCGAAVR